MEPLKKTSGKIWKSKEHVLIGEICLLTNNWKYVLVFLFRVIAILIIFTMVIID